MTAQTTVAGAGSRRFLFGYMPILLLLPVLILLLLFFVAPMYQLVALSLMEAQPRVGESAVYGTFQYLKYASDSFFLGMTFTSLLVGASTTVLTLIIAYPVAYYITVSRGWERTVVSAICLMPIFINLIVGVLGWYILLLPFGLVQKILASVGLVDGPLRWLRSLPTLLIVLVYEHLPFAVLVLVSSLQSIPRDKIDAARTLGASTARIVTSIILPLTMPGLVTCVVLIFSLAVSSYLAPVLISGQAVPVVPLAIFTYGTELLNWPFAAALSVVLLVAVVTLTMSFSALANILSRRSRWELV